MNRDEAFGRLLAISNVLSARIYEKGRMRVADKYLDKLAKEPQKALAKIHTDLMEYSSQFGEEELQLMDMFGEIMANLKIEDFTNEPLNPVYLLSYYSQQHTLNNIMGVEDAAKKWGLSPGYIKNLCAEGKVQATKIGKTWVLDKNQPRP